MPKRIFFEETHFSVINILRSVVRQEDGFLFNQLLLKIKPNLKIQCYKDTKIWIYSTVFNNSRTSLSIIAVAPQTIYPFNLKAGTSKCSA